jgi:hypothetical protein
LSPLTTTGEIVIFLSNFRPIDGFPAPPDANVSVACPGVWVLGSVVAARVDATHANPHAAFVRMGLPPYPTPAQLQAMRAAATVQWDPVSLAAVPVGSQGITVVRVQTSQ